MGWETRSEPGDPLGVGEPGALGTGRANQERMSRLGKVLTALTGGEDRPINKSYVTVLGRRMAYVEQGDGIPVVFLAGSVGASFLWRGVLPEVSHAARAIAVDLIGTGDSDRILPSGAGSYSIDDHYTYLSAFLEVMEIDRDVVLVLHGWTPLPALQWARYNPDAVVAVCYLEAAVAPLRSATLDPGLAERWRRARAEGGAQYVLRSPAYLNETLAAGTLRGLAPRAEAEYRRLWGSDPEQARAELSALAWMPLDGEPSASARVMEENHDWLAGPPKLLIRGEPGLVVAGPYLTELQRLPNQTEVLVPGTHLLPEDSPSGIGAMLRAWLRNL
jgi:haloalkane dehalogenase